MNGHCTPSKVLLMGIVAIIPYHLQKVNYLLCGIDILSGALLLTFFLIYK